MYDTLGAAIMYMHRNVPRTAAATVIAAVALIGATRTLAPPEHVDAAAITATLLLTLMAFACAGLALAVARRAWAAPVEPWQTARTIGIYALVLAMLMRGGGMDALFQAMLPALLAFFGIAVGSWPIGALDPSRGQR
jgi:hypothetical protein